MHGKTTFESLETRQLLTITSIGSLPETYLSGMFQDLSPTMVPQHFRFNHEKVCQICGRPMER